MRYLSVCSGIEAATAAWHPLGWVPAAFSEIEAFPRAVLQHHYPTVPLHGDFTTIKGNEYGPIDLLVGGTPCQDFSIAGLRAGIAGERGNLTLEFLRLAARARPRWIVWENVPGLLSSDEGRALGAFLGGLAELGYGFAYRILDAQYSGLAQRRDRVFVVAHLGDWRCAGAVLLERESLRWDPPPRREAGQGIARPITPGSPRGSGYRNDADTADNLIAHALRGEGFDASEDGTGRGVPLVIASGQANAEVVRDGEPSLTCLHEAPIVAFDTTQITSPTNRSQPGPAKPCHPLSAEGHPPAIAFSAKDYGADASDELSPTLRSGDFDKSHANGGVMPAVAFSSRFKGDDGRGYERPPQTYVDYVGAIDTVTRHSVASGMVVRRLTPRECERLQGFPDDYTLVTYRGKPAADGPRYKALGNSMAVPVMRWIGERIALVEQLTAAARAA